MSEDRSFELDLKWVEDFEFNVRFDWENVEDLTVDEPEPIGRGKGPNATRLLAAAVGNCLSASLLFCLQKSRVEVAAMATRVRGGLERNEAGRMRVGHIDVEIKVDVSAEDARRLGRCLELFEDFCVVTASVRQGIEVRVRVVDPAGKLLHSAT